MKYDASGFLVCDPLFYWSGIGYQLFSRQYAAALPTVALAEVEV